MTTRYVLVPPLSPLERTALVMAANRGLATMPGGRYTHAAQRAIAKVESVRPFSALGPAERSPEDRVGRMDW